MQNIVMSVHNSPLRSKDPRDSVVVLIENSTFFPFFKFDFRHEYDEILNIFSFDWIIMLVLWVFELILYEFKYFSTYNLRSKTLLQFHKSNFSHHHGCRHSLIYECLFFDFLQLSFSSKSPTGVMWHVTNIKCWYYSFPSYLLIGWICCSRI